MSRGEEKRAKIAAVVDEILRTGTSVPTVVDMLAAILRELKFIDEAKLLEEAVAVMLGASPDVVQIATWFEEQAAKECALLDSDQLRPDARERTQERWLVYKTSAQSAKRPRRRMEETVTNDEYQRICGRLARKAIRFAKEKSADKAIVDTDVVCPRCTSAVGTACAFTVSGQQAPEGFVHDVRAVAAIDAQREHWIDLFLDEHLPDIDADVLLEVTSHPTAFEKSAGNPAPSREIAAVHAFQADVWAAIHRASPARAQVDELNHRAPGRDADGEPGNVSE